MIKRIKQINNIKEIDNIFQSICLILPFVLSYQQEKEDVKWRNGKLRLLDCQSNYESNSQLFRILVWSQILGNTRVYTKTPLKKSHTLLKTPLKKSYNEFR